jgi:hypothetical protein
MVRPRSCRLGVGQQTQARFRQGTSSGRSGTKPPDPAPTRTTSQSHRITKQHIFTHSGRQFATPPVRRPPGVMIPVNPSASVSRISWLSRCLSSSIPASLAWRGAAVSAADRRGLDDDDRRVETRSNRERVCGSADASM